MTDLKKVQDKILYQRIKTITKDEIVLENGVTLTIDCVEQDCCAGGYGSFNWPEEEGPPLDAMITAIGIGEQEDSDDYDGHSGENTVTIFHNRNSVVTANAYGDAGNGGYYYSITCLIVDDIQLVMVSV